MFQPVGQQVQRRRRAVSEDDLAVLAGIQPAGGLATAGLERLSGVCAGQMLGTMHIGGTVGIVMSQGVDQRLGLLRRGGVVQISLALPLQGGDGGEVATPGREEGHCSSSVWRRVQSQQP